MAQGPQGQPAKQVGGSILGPEDIELLKLYCANNYTGNPQENSGDSKGYIWHAPRFKLWSDTSNASLTMKL